MGRHLKSLLSLGLASRTTGRPARYVPAVPEAAVELLALRKQAAIVEARLGASVLTTEFRRPDSFTVIRGAEAVAQRFYQAQQSAQTEVLVLDPPYVVLIDRATACSWGISPDHLRHGVAVGAGRPGGCQVCGLPDPARRTTQAGCGGSSYRAADESDVVVELGASSLLDALLRLFELLWQQASPLSPSASEGPLSGEDSCSRWLRRG